MRFTGWPPEAVAWFEGLEQDNSKRYFDATRAVYDECVKGPLLALLEEVADEFGPGRMFRPHRDVRFSADKSPYKTQASAVLHREGRGGASYVEVSADGLLAGAGYYQLARDQLARFRRAVLEDTTGDELMTIVEGLERGGYRVGGEALKTAPRGYDRDHPRVRLLRHKGLAMFADKPPGTVMATRRALTHVTTTWRAGGPLTAWLDEHVGPSEEDGADVARRRER